MKVKAFTNKQQGAVTLLTALVLLISITLISLLTAKTVLVETQITADNYRTTQATAAASAAMDQAVAYFSAGGLDQIKNTDGTVSADGKIDYAGPGVEPSTASCTMPAAPTFPLPTPAPPFSLRLTLASGAQTTYAQFYFNNTDDNACDCQSTVTEDIDHDGDGDCMGTLGRNMTRAMVIAKGWSDDCTAVRTITQCVATYKIFRGDGPQQPFVSKAGVGVFGHAKIINRYNNSSIWSGGADDVHGASYGTYLRPSGKEVADYTTEQLDRPDTSNTQPVSDSKTGNGIDVVTSDPTLASKTTSMAEADMTSTANNQFFDMFFAHTKAEIKNAADTAGQMFPANTNLDTTPNKTGLIWVNGDTGLNGGTVGSAINPAILIINGNFTLSGSPTIFGVIYVTGELTIHGTPVVKGSIVSEAGPNTGTGNLTLVYKPWGDDGTNQEPQFITGTGTVIAGSWKDW